MSTITEKVKIIGYKGTKETEALIDTGASSTHMREDLADAVGVLRLPINGVSEIANGSEMPNVSGFAGMQIRDCTVPVFGRIIKTMSRELIIGADFLQIMNAKVDLENDRLEIKCPPKKDFLI